MVKGPLTIAIDASGSIEEVMENAYQACEAYHIAIRIPPVNYYSTDDASEVLQAHDNIEHTDSSIIDNEFNTSSDASNYQIGSTPVVNREKISKRVSMGVYGALTNVNW
jgi:hypothetical protein